MTTTVKVVRRSDSRLDAEIVRNTRDFNSDFAPSDSERISVYCYDAENVLVGGLTGKTYWSYLEVEYLWVHEKHRKLGIGATVLQAAEHEAMNRGCHRSMLDTYEFQALDFYAKQGYEVFGKLELYCEKYSRYFLRKKLEPE